jgi:hypothetical protein
MRTDSIQAALDSAFEMSTGPGLYMLAADPYRIAACPGKTTEEPGILCTQVYGVAGNVDVDTQLSGRQNTFPRGLYNAPPLPERPERIPASSGETMPPTIHKARGSMRGNSAGPVPERIGREWVAGNVDIQDATHFIFETTGLSRGGADARQHAKDSVDRHC